MGDDESCFNDQVAISAQGVGEALVIGLRNLDQILSLSAEDGS